MFYNIANVAMVGFSGLQDDFFQFVLYMSSLFSLLFFAFEQLGEEVRCLQDRQKVYLSLDKVRNLDCFLQFGQKVILQCLVCNSCLRCFLQGCLCFWSKIVWYQDGRGFSLIVCFHDASLYLVLMFVYFVK